MKLSRSLLGAALLLGCGVSLAATLACRECGRRHVDGPALVHETLQLGFTGSIYEPLVGRGKDMALVPALATKWTKTSPTVWRFDLRHGVTFHDGTPFTADDVVFTFKRASGDGSDMKGYTSPIKEVRKVKTISPSTSRRRRPLRSCPTRSPPLHDEQEVVRGEQGRAAGGQAQGHREHRVVQVQRHRARTG
jgi:ABC-type oligopeptide transport system substrate-binding subunit